MALSLLERPEIASPYTDWRLPKNRIEAFSRVAHVRAVEGDTDHFHVAQVICDLMKLSDEEKALYCLFFGQSYRNHHAMIALQLDLYGMGQEQLQSWSDENWMRFKFGNDAKWNVRRFPHFVKSLKEVVGSGSIYQHFYAAAHVGDTKENYYSLISALEQVHSLGRMCSWLAAQTFYELFQWDIDHHDLQLHREGTWSQYNSLCYLFDRLDIASKQKLPNGKVLKYNPTRKDREVMSEKTAILMKEVNKRLPFHADIYSIESVLCEYRKTSFGPKIKEFTFWTSTELVEQFTELKAAWADYEGPGKVDWTPYISGFMTKGSNLVDNYGYDRSYFDVMVKYGLNLNTHYIYTDEPDAHALLNLPKRAPQGLSEMQKIWDSRFTAKEQQALRDKHNPVRYLKFKDSDHPAWKLPNVDYAYAEGFI